MRTHHRPALPALLLSTLLAAGCGPERDHGTPTAEGEGEGEGAGPADSGPSGPLACAPGARQACLLEGGSLGVQVCHAERTWGPCNLHAEELDLGLSDDSGTSWPDLSPQTLDLGLGLPDAGKKPPVVRGEFGCPDIYDENILPTFELEIEPGEWSNMVDEYLHWQEREAQGLPAKVRHPLLVFRYGDEEVRDAMIRLKGNPCCSWTAQKMQFDISFNSLNKDHRFHGVRKIDLDAPPYDPTQLRNRLALTYLRHLGIAASCVNNARLVVNGRYYGLYTNIEHMDREFLERSFGDAAADGNLYKYGRELRTNEGHGDTSRKDAFWATTDPARLAELGDLDEIVLEWAAEAMMPQGDGYWAGSINYYLYDHPTRGILFLPWDLDLSFSAVPADADPIAYLAPWGGGPPQFAAVLADPAWHRRYLASLHTALAVYQPARLQGWVDAWSAQIEQASVEDPMKAFSDEDHTNGVRALRQHVADRAAWVEAWLACKEGVAVGPDRDHDGFDMCHDCNDADVNVHPGAPERCNSADDDCNGVVDDGEICPDCSERTLEGVPYLFCIRPRSWYAGLERCHTRGLTLAVPRNPEEQEFFAATVAELGVNDEWWIGANDETREGAWQDTAGDALDYLPWAEGRPNGDDDENCAITQTALQGAWNDRGCEAPRPLVCGAL